jgi:putative transposase
MGVSTFETNSLVLLDKVLHRLIRKITETCWQLEEVATKRVVEFEREQLQRKYLSRELVFVNCEVAAVPVIHDEISGEEWEVLKVRRLFVIEVLNEPSSRAAMRPRIAELWNKIKKPASQPSWGTVQRWRKRFIQSGSDIHSLRDRNALKGNRKSSYPEETRDLCINSISTVFLTRERGTVTDALNNSCLLIKQANKLRPQQAQLKLPCRSFLQKLINKIPAFDRYAARFGYEAARQRFRYVGRHRTTERPLERAEIDHTLLDLFVVDDVSCLPLGRPYLTCCIDDYSRCILGIHIGFTPPSFQSVGCCLKHAFSPKNDLQEKHPEIRNRWEAHGVMRELSLDNGAEFHSRSLEEACLSLGIEMHYSARKSPWQKGKIERFFGTLNTGVAHIVPGTTFSGIVERGDYDPAEHAVIRLSTLRKIIPLWIADVYHQQRHGSLDMSPAQMWASSIMPDQIRLPEDLTALDVILGVHHDRVLTHKGVEFECLSYNSPELHELCLRFGHNFDVKLRVDEDDIGHAYVIHPRAPSPIKVPALRKDYANGISLWQHRVIRQYALKVGKLLDNPDGWLEAKEEIANIIARELQLKRKTSQKRIGRFQPMALGAPNCNERSAKAHSETQQSTNLKPISGSTGEPGSTTQTNELEEDVKPYEIIVQDRKNK